LYVRDRVILAACIASGDEVGALAGEVFGGRRDVLVCIWRRGEFEDIVRDWAGEYLTS